MNQSYFQPAESLTEQVSSAVSPSEMIFLSAVTVAVGLEPVKNKEKKFCLTLPFQVLVKQQYQKYLQWG